MNEYGVLIEPGTVCIQRMLPGPIERVWAYLTESEKRRTWLASGEMDPMVGGQVHLEFNNSELTDDATPPPERYRSEGCTVTSEGRITLWEPPRQLAFTWSGGSHATFELTPSGAEVMLVVTHRKLDDRGTLRSVAAGWHTHLDILQDRLRGQQPWPFWPTHTRLEQEYERLLPAA